MKQQSFVDREKPTQHTQYDNSRNFLLPWILREINYCQIFYGELISRKKSNKQKNG